MTSFKIKIFLPLILGVIVSFFGVSKTLAYQGQLDFSAGKSWSGGDNQGIIWKSWTGLSSNPVVQIQMALANGDGGVQWKLCLANRGLYYFPCSNLITVTSSNFYTFTFPTTSTLNENDIYYAILDCVSSNPNDTCGYPNYSWHLDMFGSPNTNPTTTVYGGPATPVQAYYFQEWTQPDIPIPFAITSPLNNDPEIQDSWITVSGTCPYNGTNRIGFTNDCLGFNNINYNVSCVSNTFSGQFYYDGLGDKRVIARDASSISGDCVDYDNLMDFKTVRTIEVINGYPDQWYANLDYYPDYDIKIVSPKFDTALTLPAGSTSSLFTFQFIYPATSTLSSLVFNVKQYDQNGNLLNGSYINTTLSQMANTQNYQAAFVASSTIPLNYVVQLIYSTSTIERQYPFAIYVSDLTSIVNPDQSYLFPRLIDELKTKIIFNYFFAFHDDFYNLFNGGYSQATGTALDITFKSVSGDKQYNMNVQIFSASDPNVKAFTAGLRPYITAFLWITFATYVVLRVTYLFSGSEGPEE